MPLVGSMPVRSAPSCARWSRPGWGRSGSSQHRHLPVPGARRAPRAVETAFDVVGDRVPLLVGVGALRTDAAVHLAQDAKGAGAQAGFWPRCPTRRSPRTRSSPLRDGGAGGRPAAPPLRQSRYHAFPVHPGARRAPRPGAGHRAIKSPAAEPEGGDGPARGPAPPCPPGSASATAATGTRRKRCSPVARPGTASWPACFRARPRHRSRGGGRGPPRRAA